MEQENQIPLQQVQQQEEQTKLTKGGANESKSQPVIPVATQPKPLTMEDVGRRCQQIIRCSHERKQSRMAIMDNRNEQRN